MIIAVLDACVLYPAPIRDLLLRLAAEGLYRPRWSDQIMDEWIRSLLANRADISAEQLGYTKKLMNQAFPDATVSEYSRLIETISLPDPDDRHVVAAAIRAGADLIVTYNLSDFPIETLQQYDIQVQSPDKFVSSFFEYQSEACCRAVKNQLADLTNPPQTLQQLLSTLEQQMLYASVELIRENCI